MHPRWIRARPSPRAGGCRATNPVHAEGRHAGRVRCRPCRIQRSECVPRPPPVPGQAWRRGRRRRPGRGREHGYRIARMLHKGDAVTQTDAGDARASRRIFGAALLLSVLVHLLGFLLYAFGTGAFVKAHLLARARPTPPPVYVTISNAITVRKRAIPLPVPRPMSRDVRPSK